MKYSSRVPRYQNIKFFDGFCEKFFKSLPLRGGDLEKGGTLS